MADSERRTLTTHQEVLIESCYQAIMPSVKITAHENFFDAGGDSIQLVKLVQLIQAKLGVSIPLADFLYSPTRATLVEAIIASLP